MTTNYIGDIRRSRTSTPSGTDLIGFLNTENNYEFVNSTLSNVVSGLAADTSVDWGNLKFSVYTGQTPLTQRSRHEYKINVKDFGAVGDSVTNDALAIQAAIDYAHTLSASGNGRGACVYFPRGHYKVTSTLYVRYPRIRLVGDGSRISQIVRNTDYGQTFVFTPSGGAGAVLEHIGVEGLSVYHDNSTADSSYAHFDFAGHNGLFIDDVAVDNGTYGLLIRGGNGITIRDLRMLGQYASGDPQKKQIAGLYFHKDTTGFTTTICTDVSVINAKYNPGGGANTGAQYGYLIQSAEHMRFINSGGGNCNGWSVALLQNGIIDETISDVSFDGCYFDSATNYSFLIDGTAATGNKRIASISIGKSTFHGQAGDATTGLYVAATTRAGAYPDNVDGLNVHDCTVLGYKDNGVNIRNGRRITFHDNNIYSNNYLNTTTGSGLVIGSGVSKASFHHNRIGYDLDGDATQAYQKYGIDIESGATNLTVADNDLMGNATAAIRDSSAVYHQTTNRSYIGRNKGVNPLAASSPTMATTGVDFYNPLKQDAKVSVFGVTFTDIKLNGQTIYSGVTSAIIDVPAQGRIQLNWSAGSPSWVWWGME